LRLSESKNLANLVKIRQKSLLSSRPPVFVISSVFGQKRNPLKPTRNTPPYLNYSQLALLQFSQ